MSQYCNLNYEFGKYALFNEDVTWTVTDDTPSVYTSDSSITEEYITGLYSSNDVAASEGAVSTACDLGVEQSDKSWVVTINSSSIYAACSDSNSYEVGPLVCEGNVSTFVISKSARASFATYLFNLSTKTPIVRLVALTELSDYGDCPVVWTDGLGMAIVVDDSPLGDLPDGVTYTKFDDDLNARPQYLLWRLCQGWGDSSYSEGSSNRPGAVIACRIYNSVLAEVNVTTENGQIVVSADDEDDLSEDEVKNITISIIVNTFKHRNSSSSWSGWLHTDGDSVVYSFDESTSYDLYKPAAYKYTSTLYQIEPDWTAHSFDSDESLLCESPSQLSSVGKLWYDEDDTSAVAEVYSEDNYLFRFNTIPYDQPSCSLTLTDTSTSLGIQFFGVDHDGISFEGGAGVYVASPLIPASSSSTEGYWSLISTMYWGNAGVTYTNQTDENQYATSELGVVPSMISDYNREAEHRNTAVENTSDLGGDPTTTTTGWSIPSWLKWLLLIILAIIIIVAIYDDDDEDEKDEEQKSKDQEDAKQESRVEEQTTPEDVSSQSVQPTSATSVTNIYLAQSGNYVPTAGLETSANVESGYVSPDWFNNLFS